MLKNMNWVVEGVIRVGLGWGWFRLGREGVLPIKIGKVSFVRLNVDVHSKRR
jgi:hypothetical protein